MCIIAGLDVDRIIVLVRATSINGLDNDFSVRIGIRLDINCQDMPPSLLTLPCK